MSHRPHMAWLLARLFVQLSIVSRGTQKTRDHRVARSSRAPTFVYTRTDIHISGIINTFCASSWHGVLARLCSLGCSCGCSLGRSFGCSFGCSICGHAGDHTCGRSVFVRCSRHVPASCEGFQSSQACPQTKSGGRAVASGSVARRVRIAVARAAFVNGRARARRRVLEEQVEEEDADQDVDKWRSELSTRPARPCFLRRAGCARVAQARQAPFARTFFL